MTHHNQPTRISWSDRETQQAPLGVGANEDVYERGTRSPVELLFKAVGLPPAKTTRTRDIFVSSGMRPFRDLIAEGHPYSRHCNRGVSRCRVPPSSSRGYASPLFYFLLLLFPFQPPMTELSTRTKRDAPSSITREDGGAAHAHGPGQRQSNPLRENLTGLRVARG